jgi:hypothetical protein
MRACVPAFGEKGRRCRPISRSDPAGDVWVVNNWQDIESCFGVPSESTSTRCGGQGVVVFFGMAKPVRASQIDPARQP